jgi:HSP20 family protein
MLFSKEYPIEQLFNVFDSVNSHRPFFEFAETVNYKNYPAVNLVEKGEEQTLVAELPGVKKEDLVIEVKNNLLRIKGKRVREKGANDSSLLEERRDFDFDRSFKLSYQVDAEKVVANLEDGILTINLPCAESDKPKTIEIS